MTEPAVRSFDSALANGPRLGDRRITMTPAVEASEGGPLSAYTAHLGRGERADVPAPYDEVWVVVSGRLRIVGPGGVVTAGAGEYLHVPRETPGELEAVEDTTLVCVSVPAH
ncbi:hypothetical protein Bcav_3331 [Beutenbergia cavernae DSM 12333]|uniref:Cupin 2 conserved barrel domain protein n=1 Tax=Beutenbergia cavernae (strain ATCC BAA-8 / DSM 12333 / CCUG 43141 / JCM 11478 / NBRC 16432 / NCIMB 13614 / HKI 0122) TaxID=471853 RepID=C5C1G4_BEUC1|nr:cupin [Beutenbergia cavernae]ACQ81574.1 hypothetical protein Bcav_3331 [Beutenbergia cavernae DSM 12333]